MGKRKCKLLTVSMSPELKQKFDDYCEENIKNKSRLVEWLIEQYMQTYVSQDVEGQK